MIMKKSMKFAYIAVILSVTMILSSGSIPLMAEENSAGTNAGTEGRISSKEEVIYCLLDHGGRIKETYVVNILNVTDPGVVYDHGSYSLVKNLTDTGELVNENGKVKINAAGGRFYYQGNLSNTSLPWIIDISYYLDNAKIEPKDLAGASGHVKIEIGTRKNSAVDSGFFENYLLQVTAQLNTGKFRNIVADGATFANAGENKVATFTVLPGTEEKLYIEADVTGFEMDGLEFSAIPFSMQVQMPDLSEFSDDFSQLADAIAQLNTGMAALEKGLTEIASGASALVEGSTGFKDGLAALTSKSNELIQASTLIMNTLNDLNAMMSIPEAQAANPQLAYALAGLAENYKSFHAGLEGYTFGVNQLAGSYPELHSGIEGLAAGVNHVSIGAKELGSGTNTLYENTKDLPQKVEKIGDELLSEYDKSDYRPVSFISSENKNVSSVQFVMRTEKIEKKDATPVQAAEPEAKTIWTRLLDLFR